MTMNIHKIGVVGAGQMGAGIAQVAAMAGYSCAVPMHEAMPWIWGLVPYKRV